MKWISLLALLLLSGCGASSSADGDDTSPTENTDGGGDTSEVKQITIDGLSADTTVSETELIDLSITSMNSTITISAPTEIRELYIAGQSNYVTFEEGVTVENCSLDGMSNYIVAAGLSCSDDGMGNEIVSPS